MSERIRLDAIAFDAGTQIRAAIDQQVVSDYAEAMTGGATFPAIALFHDGTRYYLADGFHRFLAAQRLEFRDIDADVRPGTKEDALWFAIGANRQNGSRLSTADKKKAILMAFDVWPDKTQAEIASHVGCSQQFVSQVTATCKVQRDTNPFAKISAEKADAIEALLRDGQSIRKISADMKASVHTVARIRDTREIQPPLDRTSDGVAARRDRMREMAEAGYTTRQIASKLGVSEETCKNTMRREGFEATADRVVGKTKRHDSNRIVGQIVSDAENLTEGINLIDYDDLDHAQIADWLRSLQQSRDKLNSFIRRLTKEQQNAA